MRIRSSVEVQEGELLLTATAKECRTACLRDALHLAPTALGWARLSFSAIDGKGVLKVAERTVGRAIITQCGAAGCNGIIQHVADHRHQALGPTAGLAASGGQTAGQTARAQFCAVKRFAHIDVAKAGNVALIEQKRFEVRRPALCPVRDVRGVQLIAERLNAHFRKVPARVDFVGWHKIHEAKPPRVIVGNTCATFEMEYDMVVSGGLIQLMREFTWTDSALIRLFDGKTTAHAKMHYERFISFKFRNEVLGAPVEPRYFPAFGSSDEVLWKRKPKVCAALFNALQAHADHDRLQATANGFNFGQFGQNPILFNGQLSGPTSRL